MQGKEASLGLAMASQAPSLRDALDVGGTLPPCYLIGAEHRTALVDLLQGSAIASGVENLRGRSVLIASTDQFLVALALIELDGLNPRRSVCQVGANDCYWRAKQPLDGPGRNDRF